MNSSREARFRQIMSGEDAAAGAKALRAAAAVVEPFYAAVTQVRNRFYDRSIFAAHRLGRPTISVGNLTTGGTGKTPIVLWMTRRLVAEGHKPAILMRGYKSTAHGGSDERALLATPQIPVIVDPDRRRGAATALREHPQTTVFVLDDAMQHRRAARDLELVLLHAGNPFGFGHVFPRGLLREPISGLRRADAVLITHSSESNPVGLAETISTIRAKNPKAQVFQCDHEIQSLRSGSGESIPIQRLAGKRYFAFCGIGAPESFFRELGEHAGICCGVREFDDHHDYTEADLSAIGEAARQAGAEMVITTEKDWVKLERFAGGMPVPLLRAELTIRFWPDHEERLWQLIRSRITASI
jgi:tetraacyldisaccharide 4'-kinase